MKSKKLLFIPMALIGLFILCSSSIASGQSVIWEEDFETDGHGSRYTFSNQFFTAKDDYFGRIHGSSENYGGAGIGSTIDIIGTGSSSSQNGMYTGYHGNFFTAGEDLDNSGGDGIDEKNWTTFGTIDISGVTNLTFKGLFAAGNTNLCGSNTYDNTGAANFDYIRVFYTVDGGTEVQALLFSPDIGCNPVPMGVDVSNEPLYHDPNMDGDGGEGTLLTNTFQEFSFPIPEGNTLSLRVETHADSGNEEMAYDWLRVEGTSSVTFVCPTIGGVSVAITGCDNENFDITVSGLANMTLAENGEANFNVELVAFPTAVDPYTAAGGTLLGTLTNPGNGSATYSDASIGTAGSYFIYARLAPAPTSDGTCKPSALDAITINAAPNPSFSSQATYCLSDATQTGLSGGSPSGGTYSGPGVTDNGGTFSFSPSNATVGVHTIEYEVTSNGCSETATTTIEVTAVPPAPSIANISVCPGGIATITPPAGTGGMVTLAEQDFDGGGLSFTPSADFRDTNHDYFFQTDGSNISTTSGAYSFIGNGNQFWAAEDTDDTGAAGSNGDDEQLLTFNGIAIGDVSDISIALDVAVGNLVTGTTGYDELDHLIVEYSTNINATWMDALCFNYDDLDGPGGPDNSNEQLHHDPNCDNDGGEGSALTLTAQTFTFNIPNAETNGAGATSLFIRIRVFMDSATEEVAFDNIIVKGVTASSSYKFYDANPTSGSATLLATCSASYDFQTTVGNSPESVWVTACGSTCDSEATEVVITQEDVVAPSISCPGTVTDAILGFNCMKTLSDYTVFVNASDNCDTDLTITQSPEAGTVFTGPQTVVVTLTATDDAGLMGTCTYSVPMVDTSPPTANCQSGVTVKILANGMGTLAADDIDNGSTDNCGIMSYSLGTGEDMYDCDDVGSTIQVTLTVTDNSGNPATCTAMVTVEDNVAPEVECQDVIVTLDPVTGTASANPSVNGALVVGGDSDNCGLGGFSVTGPTSYTCDHLGVNNITMTQFDENGNSTPCSYTVTVQEGTYTCNQPPVAACKNIMVNADANCQGTAVAADFDDGSTDPDGDNLTFSVSPEGPYALGTTNVTLTVSDGTVSSTCPATITVEDNTNPTVSCPTGITVSTGSGNNFGALARFPLADDLEDDLGGANAFLIGGVSPPNNGSFCNGNGFNQHLLTTNYSHALDATNFGIKVDFNINSYATISYLPMPIIVGGHAFRWIGVVVDINGFIGVLYNNHMYSFSTTTVNLNQWYETELRFENGEAKLYLDNVLVHTATTGALLTSFNPAFPNHNFLTQNNSNGEHLSGCIRNLEISSVVENNQSTCDAIVDFTVDFSDNCAGASLNVTPTSGSIFPKGTTPVLAVVTDAAGHSAQCSFNVTVNDTEAPTANCPANITVSNNSGECGADVSFSVTASDNCPGATIDTDIASGSFFGVGTQTVNATATDAAGNTGGCSFTVTVKDSEAPTANCPNNITVSNDPGECDAVVNFAVTATDNCPGVGISTSIASGSIFAVGTQTVTATATDAAGNTGGCSFTVTVNDNENPSIICPGGFSVVADMAGCTAEVAIPTPTTSDNCGIMGSRYRFREVDENGTDIPGEDWSGYTSATTQVFALGYWKIEWMTRDLSGNQNECDFIITIEANDAPTFTGTIGQVDLYTEDGASCPLDAFDECLAFFAPLVDTEFTPGASFTIAGTSQNYPGTSLFADDVTAVGDLSLVLKSLIKFSNGCEATIALRWILVDDCGTESVSFITQRFDIYDNTKPVLNCSGLNITVPAEEGLCGATVVVPAPTATDNCQEDEDIELEARYRLVDENNNNLGPWSSWTADPSGFFEVGRYKIRWRANDGCGNTRGCTRYLTVEDTQPPMIDCFDIDISFDGEEFMPLNVDDLAEASDNCEVASLELDIVEISCEELGETIPVTATAVDDSGLENSCIAYVTVKGLPCGWSDQPIGCDGEVSYDVPNEEFTVGGADCHNSISNSSDEYAFAAYNLCGNGMITAQVTSIIGTSNGWAGVMMRETTDPGSKSISMMTNLSSNHRIETRTSDNGTVVSQLMPSYNRHWLQIRRFGNSFRLYSSSNGVSWFLRSSRTVAMDECIEVGLIVNGYVGSNQMTGTFENVTVTGDTFFELNGTPNNNFEQVAPVAKTSFEIYPNPSSGIFNLNWIDEEERQGDIEVFNAQGQAVQLKSLEQHLNTIDLSTLPGGLYFLQIKLDDGTMKTERLILQRRP